MKILFDHNVPKKLRSTLPNHIVKTAREMGWAELENGDLLTAAEGQNFELMITCDQNLSYQQNLKGRKLALVVIDTNNWNAIKSSAAVILQAIEGAEEGSFCHLGIAHRIQRNRINTHV